MVYLGKRSLRGDYCPDRTIDKGIKKIETLRRSLEIERFFAIFVKPETLDIRHKSEAGTNMRSLN
jgi:hypothetical protein